MARPQKEGLEYFPLDVDIDQDDKLVVPIAKHGMAGFGVIIKLMMEIYKNGYYYPWTQKELYVFPFKIGVESEKVNEIVIDCINSGFFCNNQYKRNQILTSYGFQKRFLLASSRRKETSIIDRYLVRKQLLHTETELMHTETKEMSAISTQSILKEIESKEVVVIESTTTDFETTEQVHLKVFGKIIMSPLMSEFIRNIKNQGYTDAFIRELMLETGESGTNPSIRFMESIFKRWKKEGIYTRAESQKRKETHKPKPTNKIDPILENRRREIAFNQHMNNGGHEDEFIYNPASGA
jgi:DNA replication protein DnaD